MVSPACFGCPLSCDQALVLLGHELRARGLAQTHRVAALRGAPDITAEGAAFAAILVPRIASTCPHRGACPAYKFLIAANGRITCQDWQPRVASKPKAQTSSAA